MKTILHIDASEFYRKVLHNKFIDAGYNYVEAKNFEEAFNVISNEPIDIIFTAVEFASTDSARFIETINGSKYKHIPIFVVTSNENQKKKEELFNLGIVDYISKSTSLDSIVRYINYFMEKDTIIERMRDLTIAVIDDSPIVLRVIKRIFDVHKIEKVDYLQNANTIIQNPKPYDIYLVDLVLEEVSGETIIRELRKQNSSAVILVISSVQNSKTMSNVLSAGADDYITKPFNMDIFMARIKTNVRSYLLIKELQDRDCK